MSVTMSTPSTEPLHTALLRDQQDLSAATQFALWHDQSATAEHAAPYRSLIPLTLPAPGEQFAFEVDLDTCSGCKACVTACHNLNGLDEHETWRSVGFLQGAEAGLPVLRHVTTACHHCVEPACLSGCPTQAYEKDAVTGIVRHLDDQCFGCQYCILMCPYEVPTFSPTRGIVRKCDMCRQRLSNDEAPACVQGCPNGAISIKIVSQIELKQRSAADVFLPTAPSPAITTPSTTYRSALAADALTVAGDHEEFHPAHAHWPLVFMLVLTQMSVGVLTVAHAMIYWLQWLPAEPSRLVLNSVAAIVGALGANCALLHLGRPLQAHRAWLGWRTSWLSREVLAFGAYVPLVSLAAAASYFTNYVSANVAAVLELLAIASGAVAVYCSAMIYIATRRAWWSAALTLRRFALTAFVLGNASCTVMGALLAADQTGPTWWDYRIPLLTMAIAAVVAIGKVMLETRWVRGAVNDADITARGAARLIRGRLRAIAWYCRAGGILSAFALPVIIVGLIATEPVLTRETIAALCILRLGISLAAELGERALFFVASVSPRMPGASLR